MTVRSNQKDHVLNTINGDIEFENNNNEKMMKGKSFQSPKRVASKRNSFLKSGVEDIENNILKQDVNDLTFQKENLIKGDLINDLDKTNEMNDIENNVLKEGGEED